MATRKKFRPLKTIFNIITYPFKILLIILEVTLDAIFDTFD